MARRRRYAAVVVDRPRRLLVALVRLHAEDDTRLRVTGDEDGHVSSNVHTRHVRREGGLVVRAPGMDWGHGWTLVAMLQPRSPDPGAAKRDPVISVRETAASEPTTQKTLATAYFPEGLPPEYLRRWRA
jgi:hypothetical protein